MVRKLKMKRKVTKAIFPVAGLGTRFLPATKSVPKEIMTLVDRPLIQYAIDEARAAGIEDFIFVTSRGKTALEDYFDLAPDLEAALSNGGKTELLKILRTTNMDSGAIAYIRQHKPLGLGHAVCLVPTNWLVTNLLPSSCRMMLSLLKNHACSRWSKHMKKPVVRWLPQWK